jgi:sigma-B regulation protein RsbU (phosphoserine phosphatase)
MKVNPTLNRKFDSSIVAVLTSIRSRFQRRKKTFLLCVLPSELVDLLKLTGVYHTFHVVDQDGAGRQEAAGKQGPKRGGSTQNRASRQDEAVRKRILHLNQSLKRTASLEKGLDSAEKCVMRFLPRTPPTIQGYDFAFSYHSSEKVGGDFFDFITLGEDHLGICIGDVSGHGIDAALLMGISKKVLHIRALDAGPQASPRKVLERANQDLVSDFTRSNFVTVLYAVLQVSTGTFTYARAGHEPPYIVGPRRGHVLVSESKGLPLAIDSGRIFNRVIEERTLQIPPGAFVFLCTDGIAECWNNRGAKYSKERLVYALEQFDHAAPCQSALDAVLKSVEDFSEGRAQEDDMTTILVKRFPLSGGGV